MVMTRNDELVQPYTSGELDGAHNVVLQDLCPADVSEHLEAALRLLLAGPNQTSSSPPTDLGSSQ